MDKKLNSKTKEAIDDLIYDLDRHFPYEVQQMSGFYEEFFDRYIKPIIKACGLED